MMKMAKQRHGLYALKFLEVGGFTTHFVNSCVSSKFDLWHFRLGHPFVGKLDILYRSYPFIKCNINKELCDACHFAKQHKLPFSININKSAHTFDLLI